MEQGMLDHILQKAEQVKEELTRKTEHWLSTCTPEQREEFAKLVEQNKPK